MTLEIVQGSDEWLMIRCGRVTASRVADVVDILKKGGYGAKREAYAKQIRDERLTGKPKKIYVNRAMQDGVDREPAARAAYEFYENAKGYAVGFVPHPRIAMAGASPDWLVEPNGLLEIKCPTIETHHDFAETGLIDDAYVKQMQFQMACTGRQWADFVSFNPDSPECEYLKQRVERDDEMINYLETDVEKFLSEIDARVAGIRSKYGLKLAA